MHVRVPQARFALAAFAALALCAGCANGAGERKAKLSEHQRDSVLATEPIPGAATVGKALDASARATADAARLDSLAN